ncbi:unnamed protein product [Cylindrotheca closterium]|uniref:Leucine-rich repeat-containing N-terminal plant-type domain-containing protein n=1 Tax=Cylindrotheca closterium TaxID=2856 RepID=A0AAD2G4Z5_9STRA|nr:unnamed protein product [Cylindrotheca closterium]
MGRKYKESCNKNGANLPPNLNNAQTSCAPSRSDGKEIGKEMNVAEAIHSEGSKQQQEKEESDRPGNLLQAEVAPDINAVVQDAVQRAVREAMSSNHHHHSARQTFPQQPLATVVSSSSNIHDKDNEENDGNDLFRGKLWILVAIVVVVAMAVGIGVAASRDDDDDVSSQMAARMPSMAPSDMASAMRLMSLIYPGQEMEDLSPAAYNAIQWTAIEDDFVLNTMVVTSELLERHALVTMYYNLRGEGWVFDSSDNWLTSTSHCDWEFVECDENGSVISLNFRSKGLQGSLPAEIGNLSNLIELHLVGNRLTGSLPTPSFGQLTKLRSLFLDDNRMKGSLPSHLGLLADLEHATFNNNLFTGQIPTAIGRWTSIRSLDLSANSFAGSSIPTEIGNMHLLESLDIAGNQLSSAIPSFLGTATSLTRPSLSDNFLSSTIPTEVFSLTGLLNMNLHNNSYLIGPVPSEIGALTQLITLVLSENRLDFLPSEIGSCSALEFVYAHSNRFGKTIPTEVGNLVNLNQLGLDRNAFTGTIPSEIGAIEGLSMLYLNDNRISHAIPSEFGRLSNLLKLQLSSNRLTSTIPAELSNLKLVRNVDLTDNILTGSVPSSLNMLGRRISGFYLSSNNFTGGLENLLCDSTSLKNFEADCDLVCNCCTTSVGSC